MRVFFWPWTSASDSDAYIFTWLASLIQSSWSVLIVILFTLKMVWSSSRVISQFHSRCPRWLGDHHLFILLGPKQPLAMLQEAHTLFQNLFHSVLMVISSMYEQVRQSPEADSKSESDAFSLDLSLVNSSPQWSMFSLLLCSSVLPETPCHCHVPLVVFWAVLHHPVVCCANCWHLLQQFQHGPSYWVNH